MELVNVAYLGSDGQYQTYSPSDTSLINSVNITATFGNTNDYIEYYIKDLSNQVLNSTYNATQYNIGSVVDPVTGTTTTLYLNPEADARARGYNRGVVNLKYNFFTRQLASSPTQTFWIKEVSTSRTEIKVARQDLSNSQLQAAFTDFNSQLAADAYFPDFYLNFGSDIQIIGINAVYLEEDGVGYILFKLYEPLPLEFDVKSTFWVVTVAADPAEFNVSIQAEPEAAQSSTALRGPNFKVAVNDRVGQTTPYYNYSSLFSTSITSSYQQLQSMMDEKGIQINVDYSDFHNFIHFSSITERLANFTYKVQLIESASAGLAATNTTSAKIALQATIDNTITKFDGYEYYLYFTSASTAWPKQTTTQPYPLYSVTSSQVVNWLGTIDTVPTATTMSMFYSASQYDNLNKDLLQYSTPAYLRDDSSNQPYLVFLDMIGQHFDNIWIYLKDVTNRFSAENNPFVGVSMDQVADALRGLGVQLYTNTSISDNIYYSLLGINPDGSLLPPTGSEVINTYVTSSIETLPSTQITNEYYKRLYHNMAYLLKTRGTERGIRALVTTFGIPNDVLRVHEFGGYDIHTTLGIQELNNTKIITSSYTPEIGSTLLTPNTTLQYYDNNLMKSSIDLEIGFSQADSINAAITSSGLVTSSLQPGYFDIMQLIGAPELQYSSSYEPLISLGNTFFAANFPNRNDVWDFIRIIKYYNNSLFKMLKDWVPARSSALTGIIVKSHLLERNKYPRHEPTYITSSNLGSINPLTIAGSSGGSITRDTGYTLNIPIQYNGTASANFSQSRGIVRVASTDDVQSYTGELSGSRILMDTRQFSQTYISSYITPWTSSIAGPTPVMFKDYTIGPLFENVTGSVISQKFLDLDYNSNQGIPVNYGLITKSIEETAIYGGAYVSTLPYSQYAYTQDYNYSYRASLNGRYSGSTLSGVGYNIYTVGDTSYGTDPVINHYTNKLGYFTQVESSSFLPGKVNITMTYLADVSGGLFELNQNNKNWQDVQNTFKAGTRLTIKQFDNKKYSNQVNTDGVKTIYNSGYSYKPQLYFSPSDTNLYFQYIGAGSADDFVAYNTCSPNGYISGTLNPTYQTSPNPDNYIYNLFNGLRSGDPTQYTIGNRFTPTFPTYIPPRNSVKTFSVYCPINIQFQFGGETFSFTYELWQNGSMVDSLTNTWTAGAGNSVPAIVSWWVGDITPPGDAVVQQPAGVSQIKYGPFKVLSGPPNTQNITNLGQFGTSLDWIEIKYYIIDVNSIPRYGLAIVNRSTALNSDPAAAAALPLWNSSQGNENPPYIYNLIDSIPSSGLLYQMYFSRTSPQIRVAANDVMEFKFKAHSTTPNYTASVILNSNATLSSTTIGGNLTYGSADQSSNYYIQSILNNSNNTSVIALSPEITSYMEYLFSPTVITTPPPPATPNSLYINYGDVNTPFSPVAGDLIVASDSYGTTQELSIISTKLVPNFAGQRTLQMLVTPGVISDWATTPISITKFLILRKFKDEQNVIALLNKTPGQTSFGFSIPDTTNPQVLAQINTLQSAVQSQTLTSQ